MASYVPSSKQEQQAMLTTIGCRSMDELFSCIPEEVKLTSLALESGKSELCVRREMERIAAKNKVFGSIFRGAGAYHHFIPAIVGQITSKEEFVTSYTPYQAEISQGLLQSIFEYQSMICDLTGMDVSNASVYDGAMAAAEAVAMCCDHKRTKALVSAAAHPQVIRTIQTYCFGSGTQVSVIPQKNGATDLNALLDMLDDTVACVYIAQPNFNGVIEDAQQIGALVHGNGAKFIMGCNPISLSVLKTPAENGADIAAGEGQPLGLPLSFGGPYLGFMACRDTLTRKLPGRIVGQTNDATGQRAFVLTLQAREQHIRREKATSNICSNQALCALTAGVYMAAMGADGMREAAEQSMAKAHYLAQQICTIPGFAQKYDRPYFNEFVTTCPISTVALMEALEHKDILGGYPIGNDVLWCATEMNTKEEIDSLAAIIREVTVK